MVGVMYDKTSSRGYGLSILHERGVRRLHIGNVLLSKPSTLPIGETWANVLQKAKGATAGELIIGQRTLAGKVREVCRTGGK